ncbi:hypothetical protein Taro_045632 [Colocasia esculenta]|uniref:Uncharacterized protein n=1 Tax=Colocasia esculenta TaxID=4460 RepID=A0A843X4I3_COLES|nr:hypothetical protein [Colocasia esculenta]
MNGAAENQEEIKYRGWKAMPYVIGNEAFNKMGDMGASANLVVYLTTVFNMSSVSAAVVISVWSGTTNMATLLGAFLADAYWGRFATIGFACIAATLGMAAMALTATIPALHPHNCSGGAVAGRPSCQEPSPGQLAFFLILRLGLMGAGASRIRPCNMAFGADQFDPKTVAGKRSLHSFFNWYYFTCNVSLVIALTVIVYVQSSVSWAVGFAIPAGLTLLSSALFFMKYGVRPEGSPFTGIVRVVAAAFRKRRLRLPKGGASATLFFGPPADEGLINTRLPHTNQFRRNRAKRIGNKSLEAVQSATSRRG